MRVLRGVQSAAAYLPVLRGVKHRKSVGLVRVFVAHMRGG